MKKILLSFLFVPLLISGCDQINSNSWSYKEEVDKLNNSKILVSSRIFKSNDFNGQVFLDFQCDSNKVLTLNIGTYESTSVKDEYPPVPLKFFTAFNSNIEFLKSRSGGNKISFPVIDNKDFNNIAKISLSGIQLYVPDYQAQYSKPEGYTLHTKSDLIQKLFIEKDWIVEIPTAKGTITPTIDLSDSNIQKIFNACLWQPAFSKKIANSADSNKNTTIQNQANSNTYSVIGKWSGWAGNECTNPLEFKSNELSLSDNDFEKIDISKDGNNLIVKSKSDPKDQGLKLSEISNTSMNILALSSGDKFKLSRCK
jgi:hypothetical protein